ncbi:MULTISPECIES: TetR/AcrR family transcriptional regulator [Paenibacillus]|uniref:TetR/AcrR family transcriptional regulator n=1 Tax=Paenibacillus TaxID=44249 RepID=UPI00096DD8A6|nr:TetR/AcrR family transcriptional regulator [Paenibacillus odorifer]OMD18319.1 TetR family transcriptional regulator [Paenibacillus odorifer]OMD23922.1 TetR family transcriptional regulator [Paenibacillus odorifer]OME24863.1 TetR family transcriptional regulator [Paenibacillus odorifer]OME43571.1 TetR family transcriptional regulator [Paenibacillus odorifer]OME49439.1 TetR family transcriptional regulator [Paenibacillus odorifer]
MESKRGRPRNVETEKSILTASYDLLLENGFGAVTVEKIADRAKVSKATIYKWWPNKAAVVMDGFLSSAADRLPVPDTGSVFDDILMHATNLSRFLISREGKIITEIIGEGQMDSGLAEAYRTRYFQPRRLEARLLMERGVQRGELKDNLDIEVVTDLIYGPIFYRLLVTGQPIDDAYVQQLVRYAFQGIRN